MRSEHCSSPAQDHFFQETCMMLGLSDGHDLYGHNQKQPKQPKRVTGDICHCWLVGKRKPNRNLRKKKRNVASGILPWRINLHSSTAMSDETSIT